MLKDAVDRGQMEIIAVATTNYNQFIQDILGVDVAFLNGSTEIWYDPYLNRIGDKSQLTTTERHILVPLMFTQSGTKPMTSIEIMVVTLGGLQSNEAIAKEIARKIKVNKVSNISILQVDRNGNSLADQKNWVSHLA